MPTNEEVKAYLECKRDFVARDCGEKETLQMAIDAIEKQIPKKPTRKASDDGWAIYDHCPSCGFDVDRYDSFCIECGQMLDWE